jgi:hypothetical protein
MAATSSFWALWLMAWLALSGCLVHASSHGHQHVPVRLSATRNVIRTDANVTVASENSTIASPASSPGATGKGPLLAAANDTAIAAARKIVADAIAQASIRNAARIQNPARNQYVPSPNKAKRESLTCRVAAHSYSLKPGTVVGDRTVTKRDGNSADANAAPAPPLLPITDEIAAAAALVAEADAAADNTGPPASLLKRGSSSYWMDNLKHLGTSPWGKNSSYKVYRNVVTDYGAVGDGKTVRLGLLPISRPLALSLTMMASRMIRKPSGTQYTMAIAVLQDATERPRPTPSSSFLEAPTWSPRTSPCFSGPRSLAM